jgi:phosphoribosylaminoimidazole (AIR) synthetase
LKILDYLEQQNYDSKLFYIQINNDKFDVTQIIKEIKNENDLKKQEIYEFINMIITYIVLYKELPFDTPSL